MSNVAFEIAPNDASNIERISAKFAAEGLVLEMDAERMVSKCVRPSKKARLGYVMMFHFIFRSTERMFEHADNFLADIEKRREFKAQRAAEKKAREEEARNDVSIGDIFVASWGYEQTQVDAYQVVGKKGSASVVLRPITTAVVPDSEHFMSQDVVPVPNAFISDETITKRVGAYGITLNSYSSAYKWDGERSYHNSWYA